MSEVNYAYSLNGEEYYGEFASREAAIAEAEEECGHAQGVTTTGRRGVDGDTPYRCRESLAWDVAR